MRWKNILFFHRLIYSTSWRTQCNQAAVYAVTKWQISLTSASPVSHYYRDRRFRSYLFNVRSMLTRVQSHKCRLKELANNISAAFERRNTLCSSSGCFVILAVHHSTWSMSRQSNGCNNNNLSLAKSSLVLYESIFCRILDIARVTVIH